MFPRNGMLKAHSGATFPFIQFGSGEKDLVIIPGLGDGMVTVRGKAILGPFMFSKITTGYRVTMISRKLELEPYCSTETMARDQAEAMMELGIRKAHVVGVSMGGMIAQHLASEHPDLIDHLILVVSTPASNPMLERNICTWLEMADRGAHGELMMDMNRKSHTPERMKRMEWMAPFMSIMGRPASYERLRLQSRACLSHDAREALPKVTNPTLVMGGELDETLGPEGSRELGSLIPKSKIFMYPDQGHALYEDAKDFYDRVIAFLERGTFMPD